MSSADPSLTQTVRSGLERACREFTARIIQMGFGRSRKMLWTRPNSLTVDFVHLHRCGSSYGGPISAIVDLRIHLGIRVLNDTFETLAFNGPSSDPGRPADGRRYHLSFHARSFSMFDRCVDDLVRFIEEQGEPWFRKFRPVENLLEQPDVPLRPEEQERLRAAQRGETSADCIAASYKLLGIKT